MRSPKWLKKFRERTQMSGRSFAEMIGMDNGNYHKYENGVILPGEEFIAQFSKACKLSEVEEELIKALVSCDRILRSVIREDEK
jgi:transcriptional regulator with XRE-family HTH domain